MDTGSVVIAFPCANCKHCGQHIDPPFDFQASGSASWVGCGAEQCACKSGHCAYHQGYTEGSSISGWLFDDLVSIGDALQHNPPVRTRLGCHTDENNLFYTQRANGIMGIGPARHRPTVLQELFKDKEHIQASIFSMCLAEWGGRMVVGGWNASYHTAPIQWTPLATASSYYNIELKTMTVGGVAVNGFRDTFIDSGTTYVYMATAPYRQLKNAIWDHCKRSGGCGVQLSANCATVRRGSGVHGLAGMPNITVRLRDAETVWEPRGYLFREAESDYAWVCLDVAS